jgi:DNA-binding NarL/FixJ family response regulator
VPDPIRVLIADDHAVVRRGLKVFLELHDDIAVVGEAADGAACVAAAAETQPDVVLLDLKMPGLDAVDVVRALHAATAAKVLIITSFTEPTMLLPVVREGIGGALYKDVEPNALAAAIRTVHSGHVLLPPDVAAALVSHPAGPDRLAHLTAREREVLGELARGKSNREIAKSLLLAEKTVKTHVSSILMKLDVADRTQAALYAVRHGLA